MERHQQKTGNIKEQNLIFFDHYKCSTVTKLVLGHLIMWQAGFPTEKLQAKGEKAVENRLSET